MRLGSSIEAGRPVAANGTRGSLPPLVPERGRGGAALMISLGAVNVQ